MEVEGRRVEASYSSMSQGSGEHKCHIHLSTDKKKWGRLDREAISICLPDIVVDR